MDTYIEFLKGLVSRGDYGSERVKPTALVGLVGFLKKSKSKCSARELGSDSLTQFRSVRKLFTVFLLSFRTALKTHLFQKYF